MQITIKVLRRIGLVMVMGICMNTMVNAQSPADDPGIGGPGAPGDGPSGDGSPTVPFDGGMSLLLLLSGIGYGVKNLRKN